MERSTFEALAALQLSIDTLSSNPRIPTSNTFDSPAFAPFAQLLLDRAELNWETIYALLHEHFAGRVVAKERIVGGRTEGKMVLNAVRAARGSEAHAYEVAYWCWKLKKAVDEQV